jgi:hypothetical protein
LNWALRNQILKTWAHFKTRFAAAHRQHEQMQGESAATSDYHASNAAISKTEEKMAEEPIGALDNLVIATAAERGVVATLTEANARLSKQLEDNSNELRELNALLKKERMKKSQFSFIPSRKKYCWTQGYKVAYSHSQFELQLSQAGPRSGSH